MSTFYHCFCCFCFVFSSSETLPWWMLLKTTRETQRKHSRGKERPKRELKKPKEHGGETERDHRRRWENRKNHSQIKIVFILKAARVNQQSCNMVNICNGCSSRGQCCHGCMVNVPWDIWRFISDLRRPTVSRQSPLPTHIAVLPDGERFRV